MDRFEQLPESEKLDRYARLARKALSAYGLNEARLAYLGGPTDVTFEVATGDTSRHYALRVCRPERSPDAFQREILWLTALCHDTDLVVPEPILTMNGELIRRVSIAGIPGFRPCILLRWVAGETLDRELAPEHLRSVGRLVAKLHAHAETFRWPEEITPPRRNATLMSEVLNEELLQARYSEEEVYLLRRATELIAVTMSTLRDGPDVAGVIHGELHRRNVLFHEGEARAIGFEACRWGYYAYDLATTRSYVMRRETSEQLIAALFDGYRSLRDLPEEVERAIPVFSALRSIDRIQSMLPGSGGTAGSARDLDREMETVRRVVEAA
jgi:Ser/Thr protein kinase RdoA (MazF antagonist)